MTLGLGRRGLVAIPTDDELPARPDALAAAIAADRAAGHRPIAIVATVGTTSSTSVDPVAAIAGRRRARGPVAPRRRGVRRRGRDPARSAASRSRGWERADSIVVNPHKWLFTPLDASLLLTPAHGPGRTRAFSLRPEYLRTLDRDAPVRDYTEFQPQLGRRLRALKLWMLLRWFGLEGLRRRIAPPHRARPGVRRLGRRRPGLGAPGAGPVLDRLLPLPAAPASPRDDEPAGSTRHNAAVMDAVNRTGEVFLSHTRLDGRFTIRLSVGNLRTEARHVERAWELLRNAARRCTR